VCTGCLAHPRRPHHRALAAAFAHVQEPAPRIGYISAKLRGRVAVAEPANRKQPVASAPRCCPIPPDAREYLSPDGLTRAHLPGSPRDAIGMATAVDWLSWQASAWVFQSRRLRSGHRRSSSLPIRGTICALENPKRCPYACPVRKLHSLPGLQRPGSRENLLCRGRVARAHRRLLCSAPMTTACLVVLELSSTGRRSLCRIVHRVGLGAALGGVAGLRCFSCGVILQQTASKAGADGGPAGTLAHMEL